MKDKDKLNRRRNHTNQDGSKNRIRDNRHKHVSQLKKDRQISRDKRSEKKRTLLDVFKKQHCLNTVQILFILDETPNNEKILLNKTVLDNDMYSLELPTITLDEFYQYADSIINIDYKPNSETSIDKSLEGFEFFENVFKHFIAETFNITADNVIFLSDNNLIVIKGITENESSLKPIVIRTYNESTWFSADTYTTVYSVPFYSESKTDIYLASKHDLGKVIISGSLLYSVLAYRKCAGKIEDYNVYSYYGGTNFRMHGTSEYVWTYTDSKAMDRLRKEEKELKYLLFGKGEDGNIHQDITKFLRFSPIFEAYSERISQEAEESGDYMHYMLFEHDTFNEFNKIASEYFSRKKKRNS